MEEGRRFLSYVNLPTDQCWEWIGGKTERGYGKFSMDGGWVAAHRWAYERFYGPIPEGLEVCHVCDNPGCVNPKHLYAGTHQNNMLDADRRTIKHRPRGEDAGTAKLTEEQVREIRSSDLNTVQAAAKYGVSNVLISKIRRREIWKHVL